MQHDRHAVLRLLADLDEVIPSAERPKMALRVSAQGIRMPEEKAVPNHCRLELAVPDVLNFCRDVEPRSAIPWAAAVCATVRDRIFDSFPKKWQLLLHTAKLQVGTARHHAAANVHADSGGHDRALPRGVPAD